MPQLLFPAIVLVALCLLPSGVLAQTPEQLAQRHRDLLQQVIVTTVGQYVERAPQRAELVHRTARATLAVMPDGHVQLTDVDARLLVHLRGIHKGPSPDKTMIAQLSHKLAAAVRAYEQRAGVTLYTVQVRVSDFWRWVDDAALAYVPNATEVR